MTQGKDNSIQVHKHQTQCNTSQTQTIDARSVAEFGALTTASLSAPSPRGSVRGIHRESFCQFFVKCGVRSLTLLPRLRLSVIIAYVNVITCEDRISIHSYELDCVVVFFAEEVLCLERLLA